jgi:type IX secretion system PorP/SprF family membrane protein
MSLGLGVNVYHMRIAATEQSFYDPSEPWLNDNLRKGIIVPDVDFGLYILDPHFDFGFSAMQMLGANVKLGENREAYNSYWMDRHYYIFGSYSFEVGVKTILQPEALFKMSEQVRPQIDLGGTYIYDNKFWLGFHWRSESAIIGNIRVKVTPSRVMRQTMYLGYAFDYTTNKIQNCTYGSHEVVLSLKFGASDKRFTWYDRF